MFCAASEGAISSSHVHQDIDSSASGSPYGGRMDVLLGLHHGQISSNSEVAVWALHPRVAIMNNGARIGGEPDVMKIIHIFAGLENLWQKDFSVLSGQEYTVPGIFIANTTDDAPAAVPVAPLPAPGPGGPPAPIHNGMAYWIKVRRGRMGRLR